MQQIIRVRRISNPRTRRKSTKVSARRGRRRAARHRSRSRNPLRVLTLGASNPRSAQVKRRRRRNKRSPARRIRRRRTALSAAPRRRRRNSRHVHRASNPRRRRRNQTRIVIRRNRRRRNQGPTTQIKAVFGGLLGVTGTKMIPGVLPAQLTGTPIMASLTSVAVAWGLGQLTSRLFDHSLGAAVAFGGYMQAGSVMLNAFIPSIGGQIALRGMRGLGELVQGAFPVPQNPLNPNQANYPAYGRAAVASPNGVTPTMNGLARAYPPAF